ncbi:MAG TPA: fumarylacetoacetate hydrolase family protein [Hyphomicrobiales bacterium]|nr:fumarylacetoacetate hydrolase family protein [Hyphomicrobiales bacterium]
MRLCQFGQNRLGIVSGGDVLEVTSALGALPPITYPLPIHDRLVAHLAELRPKIEAAARNAAPQPLAGVALKSPVANPGKIIAAPVNYRKHFEEVRADPQIHFNNRIAEIQRAGLFLKAPCSLIGPGDPVTIQQPERRTDHEIELVAVIGREGRDISREDAPGYVAGYTIGLDMTVRGPEERSLRKSLDTFTVVGPWLVTSDELGDPAALSLELTVNGKPRQKANTRDLIMGVPELIAFASSFYTLMPGDLLFTGTPEGVGPVVPGDLIRASIDRIGTMEVRVRGVPR